MTTLADLEAALEAVQIAHPTALNITVDTRGGRCSTHVPEMASISMLMNSIPGLLAFVRAWDAWKTSYGVGQELNALLEARAALDSRESGGQERDE